jgi:serine/threonine protein kinase
VVKVLASATDARRAQTAMTGTGMVFGTPEYMTPELIMGEPFDGRVDQYALATTVYEMLCGRRPFEDETKTRVLFLQLDIVISNVSDIMAVGAGGHSRPRRRGGCPGQ